VGFLTDATGHVTAVEARARSGAPMLVEARAFIIATGGIDNARLLLAAPEVLEIMGPAGNNVGRFFMEHLHYVAGHIVPSSARVFDEMTHFFGNKDGQERWLTASDTVVQRKRLTRTAYSAVPTYSGSLAPSVNALGRFARMFPYGPFDRELWMNEARTVLGGAGAIPGAMAERLRPSTARTHLAVAAMSEQSPNPDSRITLSTRRDRTGLPLPELDWRIARRDLESMQHSGEILGRAVVEAGLGEFVPSADSEHGRPPPLTGGWHHMGTTRMSAEAADGVVDQNCRVHGLENLYVAGSSVFPTSGFANPTLSLVALAVRLARHVASETM
jgi:choline dehydrogenase-like flavoprotein